MDLIGSILLCLGLGITLAWAIRIIVKGIRSRNAGRCPETGCHGEMRFDRIESPRDETWLVYRCQKCKKTQPIRLKHLDNR